MNASVRIDVRSEFALCVQKLGATVLDDALPAEDGKKPKNADFWFEDFNVIVELKCMEKDMAAEFQRRLSDLYTKWTHERRVPARWGKSVGLANVPVSCQREAVPILKEKVEAWVREANRQIRSTAKLLKRPDAAGVLLLVNDGNYGLPPEWVQYLLGHVLLDKHRAVNTVIHASVNEPISVQGVHEPVGFWAQYGAIRTRPMVRRDFLDHFRDGWTSHARELTGGDVRIYEFAKGSDPFREAKFTKWPGDLDE